MLKKDPENEIYFLRTGNYLIHFRGYFKTKKKLKLKLHEILDSSISALVKEWERSNDKKWDKPPGDIISKEDMCHSVHVMRLNKHPMKFFSTYFVMT